MLQKVVPVSSSSPSRLSGRLLFPVVLVLALLTGAVIFDAPMLVTEDGNEYLAVADTIRNGSFFSPQIFENYAIRAPLYPLLIALAKLLLGDTVWSIKVFQVFIALVLDIAAFSILWRTAPRKRAAEPFLGGGYLLAMVGYWILADAFACSVLSEWLALHLLLLFAATARGYFTSKSPYSLLMLSVVAAAIALTRPVFTPLLFIPPLFLLRQRPFRVAALIASIVGLIPVLLYMGVNLTRLDAFSISPFGGTSTFGVVSLYSNPSDRLPPSADALKQNLNALRRPATLPGFSSNAMRRAERDYNYYIWQAVPEIRKRAGWSVATGNRHFGTLARAEIVSHPLLYLRHVILQFLWQFSYFGLSGAAWCLVAVYLLFKKGLLPSATRKMVILLLLVHIAHSILCAATNVLFVRLFIGSFYPLLFVIWVSTVESIAPARADNQL